MEEFDRVLRRVERRLEAPESDRSRMLAEMAGDLEDVCEAYRERGMDPEAARRRAVRWFEPSSEAADSLRAIHTPWIERHLRRLGSSARGWVEIGAVATFSLAAAGAGIAAVAAAALASLGISVALLLALAWLVLRVQASAVRRAVAHARSELGDALPTGGPRRPTRERR